MHSSPSGPHSKIVLTSPALFSQPQAAHSLRTVYSFRRVSQHFAFFLLYAACSALTTHRFQFKTHLTPPRPLSSPQAARSRLTVSYLEHELFYSFHSDGLASDGICIALSPFYDIFSFSLQLSDGYILPNFELFLQNATLCFQLRRFVLFRFIKDRFLVSMELLFLYRNIWGIDDVSQWKYCRWLEEPTLKCIVAHNQNSSSGASNITLNTHWKSSKQTWIGTFESCAEYHKFFSHTQLHPLPS